MTNPQQKHNQKKQDTVNPSSNQSGRDFNRQNEDTSRRSERETPRGRDSVNPNQKMKKDGFDYEEI